MFYIKKDCSFSHSLCSIDGKNIRVFSERWWEVFPQEWYFRAKNVKNLTNLVRKIKFQSVFQIKHFKSIFKRKSNLLVQMLKSSCFLRQGKFQFQYNLFSKILILRIFLEGCQNWIKRFGDQFFLNGR